MDERPPKRKSKLAVLLTWVIIGLVALATFQVATSRPGSRSVEYAWLLEQAASGEVESITIDGNEITAALSDSGERCTTIGVADEEFVTRMSEHGVRVAYADGAGRSSWSWAFIAVPIVLIALLFMFVKKQQGVTGSVFTLGKSRARLVEENPLSFKDVGGLEEAKESLGDVIDYLESPGRWVKAGARLPRGVLLVGPPGCGKTLLARAVAGQASVPFYSVSASEFVEMFVGVGAARVRDMFEQAKRAAPAIVFVDELDAVGRRRGSGIGSAHDEREQTLNQLLVCLDGFEKTDNVVVIAATNRPDVLDPALLRPGRFDLRVRVDAPDRAARLETLRIHSQGKPLAETVSLEAIADQTSGRTGADLESLVNAAVLRAVRRARHERDGDGVRVTPEDFGSALTAARGEAARFNLLDVVLIESATQLAQPTGTVVVRAVTKSGEIHEGELIWADGCLVKVRAAGGAAVVIPKAQLAQLEALEGTEPAVALVADPYAGRVIDMA